MEKVFHTLEPWHDNCSEILILGTMPSPKSREQHCYYGHPQNRFWNILSAVYKESFPQTSAERQAFVLRHHLALWDVLASCEIEGAMDSSIKNEVPNNLSRILSVSPIKAVFTTGQKAKKLYDRWMFPQCGIEAVGLPSTSPANRRLSDDDLLKAYSILLR